MTFIFNFHMRTKILRKIESHSETFRGLIRYLLFSYQIKAVKSKVIKCINRIDSNHLFSEIVSSRIDLSIF